jgi:hypothetical protein
MGVLLIEVSCDIEDIEKGEKWVYANTSLSLMKKRFPSARIILYYNIACKVCL